MSVLIYCGFLLICWSIIDQATYFDTRTLAFPYVGVMIVAVSIVTHWLRAVRPQTKSWRWFGFDCLIITILMAQSVMGVSWLHESYSNGLGFSLERWRRSELMQFVKTVPFSRAIFSNAPDYIYTITGTRAAMIPRKIDSNKGLPNKRYADEITDMKERLSKGNGFILYFDTESRLWFLPSKDELEKKLPLQAIKTATGWHNIHPTKSHGGWRPRKDRWRVALNTQALSLHGARFFDRLMPVVQFPGEKGQLAEHNEIRAIHPVA